MTIPANDETKQAFKIYLLKELASHSDVLNKLVPEVKAKIEAGDIESAVDTIESAMRVLRGLDNVLDFGGKYVFGRPKMMKACNQEYGEDECDVEDDTSKEYDSRLESMKTAFTKFGSDISKIKVR